jgi:hypothetical protein
VPQVQELVAQFDVQVQAVPQAQTDWVWAVPQVQELVLVVPSVLAAVSLVVASVVVVRVVLQVVAVRPAVAVVSTVQSTVAHQVLDWLSVGLW